MQIHRRSTIKDLAIELCQKLASRDTRPFSLTSSKFCPEDVESVKDALPEHG